MGTGLIAEEFSARRHRFSRDRPLSFAPSLRLQSDRLSRNGQGSLGILLASGLLLFTYPFYNASHDSRTRAGHSDAGLSQGRAFSGFCDDIDKYLEVILDPQHASYRPRPEMEQDPTFKQLIPYCVFRCNGEVFYYQRGTAQGEARLHAKRSVGVGGHVSTLDLNSHLSPYLEGMRREIEEEVDIESGWAEECVG
jgi:hypothetical protein